MNLLFDGVALTDSINLIQEPEPFVLDKIFTSKRSNPNKNVALEIFRGSDGIAQFVTENGEPKEVAKEPIKIEQFTIPKTYEKKTFSASELAKYQQFAKVVIENVGSASDRANEMVLRELASLKRRPYRLREKLGIEALTTGKIVDASVGLNLDFGFVTNEHKFTLTGTAKWDTTTGSPTEDILQYRTIIGERTGNNANICLMGANAAKLFRKNAEVLKYLDTNNVRVGSITLNGQVNSAAIYLGNYLGVDIYQYLQRYTNASNVKTKMFTDNIVTIIAPSDSFAIHSGPLEKINEQNELEFFMEDLLVTPVRDRYDKVLEWLCEQRSVPFIHNIDNVITATVA